MNICQSSSDIPPEMKDTFVTEVDSTIDNRARARDIKSLHMELMRMVGFVERQMHAVVDKHEDDFIQAYKGHMVKVGKALRIYWENRTAAKKAKEG